MSTTTLSARKLRANRANAQKSTGPKTPEGKAVSSRNATTHGIFCQRLLLPGEDQERFLALRHSILLRLNPQDEMELLLCDRLISATWRLERLQAAENFIHQTQALEMNDLYEQKRDEFMEEPSPRSLKEAREAIWPDPIPAHMTLARLILHDPNGGSFERLSRYEQRLEQTIHRCLRDLKRLRTTGRNEQMPQKISELVRESAPVWELEQSDDGDNDDDDEKPESQRAATVRDRTAQIEATAIAQDRKSREAPELQNPENIPGGGTNPSCGSPECHAPDYSGDFAEREPAGGLACPNAGFRLSG